MVGCEHRARPLSGARPTASLNSGSVRSRRHPRTRRRSRTCGSAASPAACGPPPDPPLRQPVSARPSRRQPGVKGPRRRPTRSARREIGRSPSCSDGCADRTGCRLSSVMVDVLSLPGEKGMDNDFLPNTNDLRHVRLPNIRPGTRCLKQTSGGASVASGHSHYRTQALASKWGAESRETGLPREERSSSAV